MLFTQKWSDRIVMAGLLVGNYFYSIAKKSLASSTPLLKRTLSVSKQDLGDMSSDFSLAYGVSKLVGGALSDLLPPYVFYTVGLFLGAFANLAIAGVTDIKAIGYLWMLNGLGQGVGGPALSKVVVDLFPSSVRSSVWSNLTFACNLGYLTSTAVLGPFSTGAWQGPFLVTGLGSFISAAIMGVNYLIFLSPTSKPPAESSISAKNNASACSNSQTAETKVQESVAPQPTEAEGTHAVTPTDCSAPSSVAADNAVSGNQEQKTNTAAPPSLLSLVLKSVLLFAANFLAYFIGKGISDWTALYLMEYMQYKEGPRMQVLEIVLWSEVGGIVGSVLVGKLSDSLHNRKSLACALFTLCCILGMWALALHTPLYASATAEDSSYYPYALTEGSEHPSDANLSGALIVPAAVPTLDRDTCVDPSAFQSGDHNLCKNIDATDIVHPLQQCQSVLMATIHVMFPRADSSTLLLNQYATSLGNIISTYINMYITTDPYVTMRMVLFIVGFGINGPKTLVALELMELLPKHLCGTLTGVAGLVAQVGAACAGKFVAHTILQEGWCTFVALLTVSSVLLAAILFLSALI